MSVNREISISRIRLALSVVPLRRHGAMGTWIATHAPALHFALVTRWVRRRQGAGGGHLLPRRAAQFSFPFRAASSRLLLA